MYTVVYNETPSTWECLCSTTGCLRLQFFVPHLLLRGVVYHQLLAQSSSKYPTEFGVVTSWTLLRKQFLWQHNSFVRRGRNLQKYLTSIISNVWKESDNSNKIINLTAKGRAIAQAVSRRLHTAAVRIWPLVRSCGIYGGQSGTGAGFLWVLRFPLPILIPPTVPHSYPSIIQSWYNWPISDRRTKWTQSHPTQRN
jgi:hypothetical protein